MINRQRIERLISMAFTFAVIAVCVTPAVVHAQPSADMQAKAAAIGQTCRSDISHFCPGTQPGGGRILACLQRNVGSLSSACRNAMPDAAALKAKATGAGVMPK